MSGLQLQPKTGVDTDVTYVEAEWLMNADIVNSRRLKSGFIAWLLCT